MTPERLNKLAEMIEHDEVTFKEGREIAAYLRECAKAEPDEKTMPDARLFASVDDFIEQCGFIKGWNACRATIIRETE